MVVQRGFCRDDEHGQVRRKNWEKYGAHCASSPRGYPWESEQQGKIYPGIPGEIASLDDYKRWIDGYDTGIRYMDEYVGRILDALEKQNVLDDTAIIVSADHGENHGELGIYGDHMTADHITSRIPLIIRWPGVAPEDAECGGLFYNADLAIIENWTTEMMRTSESAEDPLWRVIREGGPFHTKGSRERYCQALRAAGAHKHADTIEARAREGRSG